MNLLICINFIVILLVSSVRSKLTIRQDDVVGADLLAGNEEKIKNIFRKQSKINVLVSHHHHENLITSLRRLLIPQQQHLFVTFDFSRSRDEHEKWISTCRTFCYNATMWIIYEDRNFRKYYKNKDVTSSPSNNETKPSLLSNLDVSVLDFCNKLDLWLTYPLAAFVLVTSIDEFELRVCCLVNRRGTFLLIIEPNSSDGGEKDLQRILATFRYMWWSVRQNLKIFVLFARRIYIFNPFVTDDAERKLHGKLEMCSDDDCSYVSLRSYHGYPMKVEIFPSAYSVIDPGKEATAVNVSAYRGPDVNVAEFIQRQMNVTS